MNSKHTELIENAIQKFGILSTRQTLSLFDGVLCARSAYRYISALKRRRRIESTCVSDVGEWFYMDTSEKRCRYDWGLFPAPLMIDLKNLNHRLACNYVYLALARRSFVSEIISEYEMNRFKIESPVNDRKPDGFFTINHPGHSPLLIAIEVETTLRNKDRIQSLIKTYVQTYHDKYRELNGVLVVCATPGIVSAYQNAVAELSEQDQEIFIISAHKDLRDVHERTLGQPILSHSSHSFKRIESRCSAVTSISNILEMS